MTRPRVAIVGHVEWVTHAWGSVPLRGHIADLTHPFDEPAGGGGVAAAAAARLGASTTLVTAFGNDAHAHMARAALQERGIHVLAAVRDAAQTPVLTIAEPDGERTIMVVGPRLQAHISDPLVAESLVGVDAAYYTGEDPALLRHVRSEVTHLIVSARRVADIISSDVTADIVVGSGNDPAESTAQIPAHLAPRYIIHTSGQAGGVVTAQHGPVFRYAAAAPPSKVLDTYGCGDTFAAGLTVGMARGLAIADCVALAATAAAQCATWRGGCGASH